MIRYHLLWICLAGMAVNLACTNPEQPPTAAAPAFDTSSEREISYLIEREDQGKAVPVSEDFSFKSGDRFRLRFQPGFPAYIYVANRGQGETSYQLLFPQDKERSRNPISKGTSVALPSDSEWLRFDRSTGNEYFVLVASTAGLPDLDNDGVQIPRESFEAQLAAIERRYRPDSSRRFRDGNWTKFFAAREGALTIIVHLALQHQ